MGLQPPTFGPKKGCRAFCAKPENKAAAERLGCFGEFKGSWWAKYSAPDCSAATFGDITDYPRVCPNRFHRRSFEFMQIWVDWKTFGTFAHPGGHGEQPNDEIEAIRILEGELSKIERGMMAHAKAKQ